MKAETDGMTLAQVEAPAVRALLVEGSLVASDLLHHVLQSSFTRPVRIETISTPASAADRLEGWDLVLVDIDLDPEGSLALLSRIERKTWRLATTLYEDEDRLLPALRCGIHGYLLKQDRPERQIESLQRAVTGRPEITPAMARAMLQHLRQEGSGSEMMVRVLNALGRGASIRETARELDVPAPTVEAMAAEAYRTIGRLRGVDAA